MPRLHCALHGPRQLRMSLIHGEEVLDVTLPLSLMSLSIQIRDLPLPIELHRVAFERREADLDPQ